MTILLIARLALAAVFVAAAVTKFADPEGSRLERYGVPRRLTGAVPLLEIVLAGLLVPAATAPAGAAAAGVFLLIASAALVRSGEDCGCFGAAAPVRPAVALARNAVLIAVAAVVALTSAPAFTGAAAIVCVAVVIFAAQWQLLVQNGRLLERIEALEHPLPSTPPVGTPAPNFVLPDNEGRSTTLGHLLGPQGLVLVFTDPACGACAAIPDRLIGARHEDGPAVAIITRGAAGPFVPTLVQHEHEVDRQFGAGQMPSAILISSDGLVASPLALGADAIERLVQPPVLEVLR